MPIIGFNFDKMYIERKKPISKDIKVKNDMVIKDIKPIKVGFAKKQEEVLKFDFKYTAKYDPNIAEILIEGNVLYLSEEKETKKILEEWKKTKKTPVKTTMQIVNTILIKCGIKALSLSQDLNLPPHIRLPIIAPKIDKSDYIG